jgi:hypothetical protein
MGFYLMMVTGEVEMTNKVIFTAEDKKRQEWIINEFAQRRIKDEFYTELKILSQREEEAEKERNGYLEKIIKDMKDVRMTFDELLDGNVFQLHTIKEFAVKINMFSLADFEPDTIRKYAMEHGIFSNSSNSNKTKIKEDKEHKPTLNVGTFQFADYGFTMPIKVSGEAASDATEFTWNWNQRFGGRNWENGMVRAIIEKGVDHFLSVASPAFKEWLKIGEEGQGPAKGRTIYQNKRDFLAKFGMAPKDADSYELKLDAVEPEGQAEVQEVAVEQTEQPKKSKKH